MTGGMNARVLGGFTIALALSGCGGGDAATGSGGAGGSGGVGGATSSSRASTGSTGGGGSGPCSVIQASMQQAADDARTVAMSPGAVLAAETSILGASMN